ALFNGGHFPKKGTSTKMQSLRGKPRGMLSHLLLLLTSPSSPIILTTSTSRPSPQNPTLLLRSSSPPSPPPSPSPLPFPRASLLGAPPPLRSRRSFSSAAAMADEPVSYISQKDAAEIDEALMGPLGFSVDQLMELAGLSVAAAIAEVYKLSEYSRVLAICGPGNNGGDGLVAARHLYHFGYKPFISYPKRTSKPLYSGLVTQLESLSIPFLSVEDLPQNLSDDFDIIVDAMFGFSFHGTPRPPFDDLIQRLVALKAFDNAPKKSPPIVSVDIPSGWHVSLTAPKLCAKKFAGPHHFLGGRFVPPAIIDKYGLRLPPYPGTSMCVRIGKPPSVDIASLRENYTSPELLEDQVMADPVDQFQIWFDEAVSAGLREPNAMALSTSGKDGKPYTNYESRKARELSENPHASLLFYWNHLNRQVRIEGSVEKVSDEESERYFHSRPRGSQLGAAVSKQSAVLAGRHAIHQAYKELEERYSDGKVIPKPDYWGGYRLTPRCFEFWQGQPSRLHDRLRYVLREVNGSQEGTTTTTNYILLISLVIMFPA
ncbi:Pyridoxine/pyridoxamine 5'-phosphate oxidase 1, chloroplastic, partial [Ananas comosus]